MKNRQASSRVRPQFEELEPRILYSADATALLHPDAITSSAEVRMLDLSAPPVTPNSISQTATINSEVVFVDTTISNYQQLIDDIKAKGNPDRHIEIVTLDSNQNGISQITEILSHYKNLDAVHLISHGSDGSIDIGSDQLNFQSLIQNQEAIRSWGNAFKDNGDFLIYGCNVAQTQFGQSFVDYFSALTNTDAAASEDATGNSALGGNWNLEYNSGAIESTSAVSIDMQSQWNQVLAITSNGTVTSANSTNVGANGNQLTWSHTVAAGTNRALFVEIAIDSLGANVTSVTYGTQSLVQVGRSTGNHAVEIWTLVAPTVGTANITVSFAGSTAAAAGATTYNGVNQTTSYSGYAGATGTGTTSSVTVTSATGDLVIDAQYWQGIPTGGAVGASQTLLWELQNANLTGGSTSETGATSVVMSGSFTSSAQWEIGAVSIKAATNIAPVITSNSGGAAASVNVTENSTAVTAVTATDANGDALTYSISGGADAAKFSINSGTGDLTFISAPNFEAPTDVGGNNVYDVTVQVSDGALTDTQAIAVTVANINEAPSGTNKTITTLEDATYTFTTADFGFTDVDSNALLKVWFDTIPNSGTLLWNGSAFAAGNWIAAVDITTGQLTYQPAVNVNGFSIASFTFRVQDDGGTANGGSDTDPTANTININISAVNDAPTFSSSMMFTGTTEDAVSNTGMLVSSFNSTISDVDAGALKGIAITSVDNTNGTWQYTLDGTNWFAIGSVSTASARLLASDATTGFRFVPNADWNGSTGLINYKAWDQTSGTTGGLVDVTVAGGTTAFSQFGNGSSLSITAVNDAPTALSTTTTLTAVIEDTTNPSGATIASLFGSTFGDVKDQVTGGSTANNFAGVAIFANAANASTEGVWQWYNNTSWVNISNSVSTSSALTLAPSTLVRFLSNANYNGTPGLLTVRLIDDSIGAVTSGSTANIGTGGGTSQYSGASDAVTLSTSITPVNDEPSGTDKTITTLEDTTYTFTTADFGFTDADGNTLTAVKISTVPAAGSLTLNGAAVIAGQTISVADINSNLLVFIPTANADGTGYTSFTFQIQDDGGMANGGMDTDQTPNTLTINVSSVNDAPAVNVVAPRTTNEDVIKVFSQFIGNAITISDVDAGNNLLQLTVSTSNGTVSLGHTSGLSFSVGDGTNDLTMTFTGTLADINNALDGIGYMPAANYNGPAQLDFNLNDLGNTGTGGALSSTASQLITVLPVNDAPVLTPYGPAYNTAEGAAPITSTVATVLSSSVTDVDAAAVQGVAIYAISGTGGLLEYSINGGSSWLAVGSVSSTSALLLRANDLLRFTPDNVNGGTMLIDYRAWDQTAGTAGTKVDTSVTGGTSEFSVANDRVTVNTSSINDAPTATIVPTNYSASEQTLLTLHGTGLSIADIDAGSATIRATITVISGTLNAGAGTTGVSISGSGGTNITLVGTTAQINDLLSGNLGGTFTYINNSDNPPPTDTFTLTAEDLGNTGSGGALTGADSATINISQVNDAPIVTTSVTTINYTENDPLVVIDSAISISDVDNTTITGATIQIHPLSYRNGEDILSFTNQLGITGNWDSGTGTLTLSGTTSVANYQAALRQVSYYNTSEQPNNNVRTIVFVVSDGTSSSGASTRDINVFSVNDAPTTSAVTLTAVTEDSGPRLITQAELLANSADVDNNLASLTASALTISTGLGSLADNGNGTWTYTPALNDDTAVSFSYTINDGSGGTVAGSANLDITPVNDAAVITPAVANLIETNAPLSASGTLVITDVDSATTFTPQTNAAGSNGYGVFNLAGDGSWTYTANTAHNEFVNGTTYTDSLTVTSADGTASTITVKILGTNDAPTASDVSLSVLEDNVLNGFLPIATDAEGVAVTYSLGVTATHGNVTVGSNGAFSYTPNIYYNGADSFTYTINDGDGGINTYTVSINVISVNNNPTASDASINTIEDTFYSGTLPTATDVENDSITYSLNTGGLHGTVHVNANGDFTYAPSANYNGADSFTYTVTDSLGGANTYTISVAVVAVNDAPFAIADSVTSLEDNTIAGNVLTNDSDVENSALTAILVSGPANGTLSLNTNGSYIYTPNANWNGTDTFTYKANDGSADSNIASVSITVTPQNDSPTTSPVTLAAILEDSGAHLITQAQLLANASDVDGDTLTVTNLSISAGNGVLVDNLNGTWTYTPASNDDTAVSFSYNVNDGSLTASGLANLDLIPVNDAPTDANLNISTLENTTYTGTLPIATDVEGDAINYTLSMGASHGIAMVNTDGSFTYTPAAYYSGADSFTYTIDDGNGGNNTYTVTINSLNVNDAPTASNATINAIEDTAYTGTLPIATDLDHDTITYSLNTGALHGTANVNTNGNFTYAPTANYYGADSFTYTVSDGLGGANTYTMTINVAAVNDLPVANNDNLTGLEDNSITSNVLTNDSDIEGTVLNATLVSGPVNGNLTLNLNGSFTYTPNANWSGTETFSYRANDGTDNSNVATVTIAITPINDAPSSSAVTLPTILKDSGAHLITQAQLLANALDVDGDILTAINLAISVGNGVLIDNTNGTWTYTPGSKDESLVTFSYTVTDGTLVAAGTAKMDIVPVIVPITPTPITPITPTTIDPITTTPTVKPTVADPANPTDTGPVNKPPANKQNATQVATAIDNSQKLIVNLDSSSIKNANASASRVNQQDTALSIIDLINLPSTSVTSSITEIFSSLTHNAQIQIDTIEFSEQKSSPVQEIGKLFFDNKIALTSVAVSAGLVAWAAQYGILFSSVLATLPAWRNLDPVAILGKDDDEGDTEWDMSDDENDQAAEENAIEILSEKAT